LDESMFDFPTPIGALPNPDHSCAVGNGASPSPQVV
jgi:hypothetical protein